MITRSQSGIVKPIDRLSLHTFSISHIPKNPSHALKDPNWRNAMYDEYNALVKNGTWLLVPRPAGVNMVRSMWLFKHKFHADGTLSRYKARLVANGSSQQLGVDFDEISLYGMKTAPRVLVFSDLQVMPHELNFIIVDAIPHCLSIDRKKYALQLLEHAHMVTCNPSRTPVDTESKLGPKGAPIQDPTLYHSLLGRGGSWYLTFTRLFGTLDLGLHLYASSTTSLVGYTDADWASCPSTRSAEAEYRGVANVYVAETCMACNLFVLEFSTCALSFPLNIANFHQGWLRIFEEFRSSLSVRPPPAPTTEAY
ncbi:ribonuclease H-like domain-containing protein [Tanacetum coccineum]|uniref:Ribonuclease H-like domain-containing protein n=1 Tax=Tanacetum coccineum TaxID=301880 RepID=A0ABQ5I0G9_9ASTR